MEAVIDRIATWESSEHVSLLYHFLAHGTFFYIVVRLVRWYGIGRNVNEKIVDAWHHWRNSFGLSHDIISRYGAKHVFVHVADGLIYFQGVPSWISPF